MLTTAPSYQSEINTYQLSATSKINIPKDYLFQTIKKEFFTKINFEEDGKVRGDFSIRNPKNSIELNRVKSELVICKQTNCSFVIEANPQ